MKYKLKKESGLFRVVALRDIPLHGVKAGDVGGLIESEHNLDHGGACWIGEDARVTGNARVYENALVYENARVFGSAVICERAWVRENATLSGSAVVCEHAQVRGNAHVLGSARVFGGAKILGGKWINAPLQIHGSKDVLCVCSPTQIAIGSKARTAKKWLKKFKKFGKKYGYSPKEITEYKKYIKFVNNNFMKGGIR